MSSSSEDASTFSTRPEAAASGGETLPFHPGDFPRIDRTKQRPVGGDSKTDILEELDNTEIDTLYKRVESEFTKKQSRNLLEGYRLMPGFDAAGRAIMLPDTMVTKPDNHIVTSMAVLAQRLGYAVKILPYGERPINDLSPVQWRIAAGISFAPLDLERKLLVKRKEDDYELGRTIARSQQVIGVFAAEKNLGLEALKKDHRWFGNNPDQAEGEGRNKLKVSYLGKNLSQYFIEAEWAEALSALLAQLLRKSHSLLPEEVRLHCISENLLSWSECVAHYSTTRVVVTPATGRKPAVIAERVPKKPRANALMLKKEMDVIDDLISPLFTAIDVGDKNTYVKSVLSIGFGTLKSRLRKNSQDRAAVLQKFAALTTKRLNEVRELGPDYKIKRKRDVTSDDVTTMLHRRILPVTSFAAEVALLDAHYATGLRSAAVYNAKGEVDYMASRLNLNKIVREAIKPAYDDLKIVAHPAPPDGGDASNPADLALNAEVSRILNNDKTHKFVRTAIEKYKNAGDIHNLTELDLLYRKLMARATKLKSPLPPVEQLTQLAKELYKDVVLRESSLTGNLW